MSGFSQNFSDINIPLSNNTNVYIVHKNGLTDSQQPTGSFNKPFKSIKSCVNYMQTNNLTGVIQIYPGTYAEGTITLTHPNIKLIGKKTGNTKTTIIEGVIEIKHNKTGTNNNDDIYSFNNLHLSGYINVANNGSNTIGYKIIIDNCYLLTVNSGDTGNRIGDSLSSIQFNQSANINLDIFNTTIQNNSSTTIPTTKNPENISCLFLKNLENINLFNVNIFSVYRSIHYVKNTSPSSILNIKSSLIKCRKIEDVDKIYCIYIDNTSDISGFGIDMFNTNVELSSTFKYKGSTFIYLDKKLTNKIQNSSFYNMSLTPGGNITNIVESNTSEKPILYVNNIGLYREHNHAVLGPYYVNTASNQTHDFDDIKIVRDDNATDQNNNTYNVETKIIKYDSQNSAYSFPSTTRFEVEDGDILLYFKSISQNSSLPSTFGSTFVKIDFTNSQFFTDKEAPIYDNLTKGTTSASLSGKGETGNISLFLDHNDRLNIALYNKQTTKYIQYLTRGEDRPVYATTNQIEQNFYINISRFKKWLKDIETDNDNITSKNSQQNTSELDKSKIKQMLKLLPEYENNLVYTIGYYPANNIAESVIRIQSNIDVYDMNSIN